MYKETIMFSFKWLTVFKQDIYPSVTVTTPLCCRPEPMPYMNQKKDCANIFHFSFLEDPFSDLVPIVTSLDKISEKVMHTQACKTVSDTR